MHQTRCLYFSFLFLSSVLQSFFSFSGSSLFGTQHQLTHLPVKSSTIPLKKMPIFRALHIGIQISLYPASFLLGTQQQLTHPPVKSSTLPFRKMIVFQGVAPWQTNFTLSCVFPLWDSATAHSPSGKELILSSLEESCFSGLIVLQCFHIVLPGLSLVWYLPILPLNSYEHLYYMWSISIVKDCRYPKYFVLCLVYFSSERPSFSRGMQPETLVVLAK